MRILCPARYPPDLAGLLWGLEEIGHGVLVCDLGRLSPGSRASAWQEAWAEFRPDLVFFFGFWRGLYQLADLAPPAGHCRVPVVYWAADDPVFVSELSLPALPHTDLILTPAEECAWVYAKRGWRAGLLQFACHPGLQRRVPPAEQHQVVLVATNYSYFSTTPFRLRCTRDVVMPLVEAGYDVQVWGSFWTEGRATYRLAPHLFRGYLPHERIAEVYSGAAIVLGLQFQNLSHTQTSSRVFETLACRALYLGPDTKGTRYHFQSGRHLVLSGSAAETLALARHYLGCPAERERIAACGQLEVYRKHTYLHRAAEFTDLVKSL